MDNTATWMLNKKINVKVLSVVVASGRASLAVCSPCFIPLNLQATCVQRGNILKQADSMELY